MGERNKTVQIIILAGILLLGVFAVSSVFKKSATPKAGSRIPNLTLQTVQGDLVQLSDYRDKTVVLNFWGSWCEPCEREMPALQGTADDWKERGVEVVGVNAGEDALVVENYMRKVNGHFPVLLDQKKKAMKAFGIGAMPTTFFIKPNGKVHAIHIGELSRNQLNAYLQQITGT